MRILDLDLDFFLDDVAYFRTGKGRLNGNDYKPNSIEYVDQFLRENCGLSVSNPIRGRVVKKHNEVFGDLHERISSGIFSIPLEIVHIDAHSDLGLGDAEYDYATKVLMAVDPAERAGRLQSEPRKVTEGNYLMFILGCRWLSSLTYVRNPRSHHDIPTRWIVDANGQAFPGRWSELDSKVNYYVRLPHHTNRRRDIFEEPSPIPLEPPIPFFAVAASEFYTAEPFDFIYLAQSPSYTPKSADSLLPIIKRYMSAG